MSRSLPVLFLAVLLGGVAVARPAAAPAAVPGAAPAAEAPTAAAEPDSASLPLGAWLALGPAPAPLPAFAAAGEPGYRLEDLLEPGRLPATRLRPRAGGAQPLPGAPALAWRPLEAPGGRLELDLLRPAAVAEGPDEVWLATYLEGEAFQKRTLRLRSAHPLAAELDGRRLELKDAAQPKSWREASLVLPAGKHLLLVHALRDPGGAEPWRLEARVDTAATGLLATIDPARPVTIDDVLDAPRIAGAAVSPDGELVAVSLSERTAEAQEEHWVEVRRLQDGSLLRSWRGELRFRQAEWAPRGRTLSYLTERDGKTTLWRHDLDSGATAAIVREVERFGRYEWAPDGSYVVYSFTIEAKPDERKVKRVLGPADREPGFRDRTQLVQVAVPGGAARRLTAGPLSAEDWRLSPDGRSLLLFRGEPDLTSRPYRRSELCRLDLATLKADTILQDRWLEAAVWSPDGRQLALLGSPSAFGGLGRELPEGMTANDYAGLLFVYDLERGEAVAASRGFAPTVQDLAWPEADGRILARCLDGQCVRLHAFDPRRAQWDEVATGLEVVEGYDVAAGARRAVAWGTGAVEPQRLVGIDLARGRSRVLLEPAADAYRDVTFGRVEQWVATLEDGQRLDGLVYYPRDFDPGLSYPCIVYYYGGTYPTTRDFAGRYPKNIWAGQGYVVYVPEPSGALGYGQEFAARHVNDWGERTAREVIEGTRAFLRAHPFVDAQRVGCIGASYGGFLTMSIVTRTDQFAAAISHAGISGIASYWGEGLWGYAYGARALAERFPWSDPELYVERSPLFRADRITTPLLLLHGSQDTNVPPGESDQLFTALKLLGREVEYVQVLGQDHHILDHGQRLVWNDTILAFFDRHLKGRPEWWDHLYPAPGKKH